MRENAPRVDLRLFLQDCALPRQSRRILVKGPHSLMTDAHKLENVRAATPNARVGVVRTPRALRKELLSPVSAIVSVNSIELLDMGEHDLGNERVKLRPSPTPDLLVGFLVGEGGFIHPL